MSDIRTPRERANNGLRKFLSLASAIEQNLLTPRELHDLEALLLLDPEKTERTREVVSVLRSTCEKCAELTHVLRPILSGVEALIATTDGTDDTSAAN